MEHEGIYLRRYQPSDVEKLAELFYQTVHTVNAADYNESQLDAWADGNLDKEAWNQSLLAHDSVVAVSVGEIVGFGDMDAKGYLDRLYVHKDYQKQGIASAICDRLEQGSASKVFSTHASITAKPFFEKRGYCTVAEQEVERKGQKLTNYIMEK